MQREIVTWGNSLGLRIPHQVFERSAFAEGDMVEFKIQDDDTLVIRRQSAE